MISYQFYKSGIAIMLPSSSFEKCVTYYRPVLKKVKTKIPIFLGK